MSSTKPEAIFTVTFVLLCTTQFLGYAKYYLLQPTFALYVTHLGGSPLLVGVVIACFSVTSVLSRPLIGYFADFWSKTGVLVWGLLAQTFSVLFCFFPFIGATMLANGIRGVGWAGMNTGGYALLATSAPVSRRGEASGYYGAVQASATIVFPALALWIINASFGGYYAVFIFAMTLGILGAGVGVMLARRLPHEPPATRSDASEVWWRSIINMFDRNIILAAALLFCLNLPTACLSSFVVLYAKAIDIEGFGWYFVATGITSLLARPLLGRASDKVGRGNSLVAAYTLEAVALVMFSLVTNIIGFMFAGALYFMGLAIGQATIFALAIEKAPPERRGRAMAGFSLAFSLSSGVGGLLGGLVVDIAGYTWMFVIMAVLCASGFVPTLRSWSQLR